MAAPKKRRLPVRIDMTAMVDVAFLLLIFFMSTTVFKQPEEVETMLPSSHSTFKLPETGAITITVPKDNRIFMTTGDASLDYKNGLSEQREGRIAGRVWTAEELPAKINELQKARLVDRVVIKADGKAEYGVIEKIMLTLQKNKLNILNLVTELEEERAPGGTAPAAGGEH